MDKKTIYYKTEQDDFVGQNINPIKIDSTYKYIHKNIFWKIGSFIVYRLIANPIAYLYGKIAFNLKFVNKKALKECKNTGYFMYSNHTQEVLDPFLPTLGNFPRKCHIVAHPDNVSIPVLGQFNKMMGGFPIPSDIKAMKNFLDAMGKFVNDGNVISVYPEAHVWPYYTKIREFKSTSFKYPVKMDKPIYVFTTTYQSRGENKKPRITVYIDGPVYPNKELNIKEAQEELRKKVYDTMCKRTKNSNIEYYTYIKENDND